VTGASAAAGPEAASAVAASFARERDFRFPAAPEPSRDFAMLP
jgi:hypothetical protein